MNVFKFNKIDFACDRDIRVSKPSFAKDTMIWELSAGLGMEFMLWLPWLVIVCPSIEAFGLIFISNPLDFNQNTRDHNKNTLLM